MNISFIESGHRIVAGLSSEAGCAAGRESGVRGVVQVGRLGLAAGAMPRRDRAGALEDSTRCLRSTWAGSECCDAKAGFYRVFDHGLHGLTRMPEAEGQSSPVLFRDGLKIYRGGMRSSITRRGTWMVPLLGGLRHGFRQKGNLLAPSVRVGVRGGRKAGLGTAAAMSAAAGVAGVTFSWRVLPLCGPSWGFV